MWKREPLTSLATGTAAVAQDNPNLDPYFSDQFDLGAEWYFSKGSVIASNLFYKDISGFIELFTRRAAFREAAGYLDLSTSYGFEAFSQKLAVSFEALNILDEDEHSYFGSQERLGGLNTPRRQFLLGLRGSF